MHQKYVEESQMKCNLSLHFVDFLSLLPLSLLHRNETVREGTAAVGPLCPRLLERSGGNGAEANSLALEPMEVLQMQYYLIATIE